MEKWNLQSAFIRAESCDDREKVERKGRVCDGDDD